MKLIKIGELSEMVGLAQSTLYKYACERKIPYFKIGNSIRFSIEDIEEWLRDKKVLKIQ